MDYKDPNIQAPTKACGTMGPAEYPPPDPSKFLRKKPKGKPPKSENFERHCMKHEKCCPLPSAKGELKHKHINFIADNVKVVKNLKPPVQVPKIVDTRNGSSKKVDSSMDPHYIHLKDFGKRPHYLLQRVRKHKQLLQAVQDERTLKDLPNCRYVTQQERQDILNVRKPNLFFTFHSIIYSIGVETKLGRNAIRISVTANDNRYNSKEDKKMQIRRRVERIRKRYTFNRKTSLYLCTRQ